MKKIEKIMLYLVPHLANPFLDILFSVKQVHQTIAQFVHFDFWLNV